MQVYEATHHSRSLNEEGATEESEVVACVEAVPEGADEEDSGCVVGAVQSVVDNTTQPHDGLCVPRVDVGLQTSRQLQGGREGGVV